MARKTGLKGSLFVAAICTILLGIWHKFFGSVAGLLMYSIVRHGLRATFPDGRSLLRLVIFAGFWGCKWMIRSLRKDAWERSKSLLPNILVLPPA